MWRIFEIFPSQEVQKSVFLAEENSHYVQNVLRLKTGDSIEVLDGVGNVRICTITSLSKKKVCVKQEKHSFFPPEKSFTSLVVGVGLLKKREKNELIVEKLTEIGVGTIAFLKTEKSERNFFSEPRLKKITISAMLQSQQMHLPKIVFYNTFSEFFKKYSGMIAHCKTKSIPPISKIKLTHRNTILIGPEGDFSESEVHSALKNGFQEVTLGSTRLRTETASIFAASLMKSLFHE